MSFITISLGAKDFEFTIQNKKREKFNKKLVVSYFS